MIVKDNGAFSFYYRDSDNSRLATLVNNYEKEMCFGSEIYQWLQQNCGGDFIIDQTPRRVDAALIDTFYSRVLFEDENDAILFGIKWIDKPSDLEPADTPKGNQRYWESPNGKRKGAYYTRRSRDGYFRGELITLKRCGETVVTPIRAKKKKIVMGRCKKHAFPKVNKLT